MKKFLKHTVIFSTLVILTFILLEVITRNIPSTYAYKRQMIENNGDKISTLILGSSHTYYGIDPEVIGDSVFNLANISQTVEYDLALLKYFIAEMPNLRRIIIPVSYFTYRDPLLENGSSKFLATRYKVEMKLPLHSDFSSYNFQISDFEGFKGKLTGLFVKTESNKCDSSGKGLGYTLQNRVNNWEEEGEMHAKNHTLSTPGRVGQVINCQKELLKFASLNNIEVIVITTPAYKTYIDNLDPLQLSEMRKNIKNVYTDNNIKYFDFLSSPLFDESDFYDVDHLNEDGAKKLSALLCDSIHCNRY